jgi:hypothetical protein
MKKMISTVLLGSLFAVTPLMPVAAAPAPSTPEDAEFVEADFDLSDYDFGGFEFVDSAEYAPAAIKPCPSGTFRVRKSTRTKKKIINSAIAGAIGTAIGAGVGGKRGALLGAGTGAGGYLVYRYVRDRRGRCVRSYR